MNRVIAVIALALCGSACSHLPPLPVLSAPAPAARSEPPPPERDATFTLTLSAPLSELEALLADQLSLPSAPDWQLVTAPGESPEVEVRYQAELLTPQIAIVGQTLIVRLEVAYFGSLRVRVHTPFGWLRLSKGTHWGDAERRARIEVEIHTSLELQGDYRLRAQSTLHEVKLSAPPIDQLCAGGAFKVCVPAELAARPIHAEIERRIRARAESGLARIDAQIAERAALAPAAQRMWERLWAAPVALASGETLQLRPRALGLSPPFIADQELTVALCILASPRFTRDPPPAPPPLPPLQVTLPVSTFVPLSWLEPWTSLNEGLSGAARARTNDDGQSPTSIALLGPAQAEGRYVVALGFAREGQSRTVYGEAELAFSGDGLRLDALKLSPDSERLLALARVDLVRFLAAATSASHQLGAALGARTRSLRALIAESVAPLPVDPLRGAQPKLVSARAGPGGLWLEAELR